MKRILILLFIYSQYSFSQSTERFTTEEPFENTNGNFTTINLFNIDFNGKKIPINMVYNHSGLKVNEKANSLGFGWSIENLGYIEQVVNDEVDFQYTGWFNTHVPNFASNTYYNSCGVDCPELPQGIFGDDISPDFFSLKTSNGLHFDFLYKKNIQNGIINYPIPVIIRNSDNQKINTNFENFYANCNMSSHKEIVFNILDNVGNNYNFINGPILKDIHRGGGNECRNNFYLKSISNPSYSNDQIDIDYITTNISKREMYTVGYNGYVNTPVNQVDIANNNDYNSNFIHNLSGDYYFVDESRLDIKKIISKKYIIEFKYIYNNYLDEINITDSDNNYLTGYKFEYGQYITAGLFLTGIKKYNNDKTESKQIYVFEYFQGLDFVDENSFAKDFLGYFNGASNNSLLPFPSKYSNGQILPAANLTPNINFAAHNTLSKITSKYGGETLFEYQLKKENQIYGGGLIIASKTQIPLIGKSTFTRYQYENLTGYIINTGNFFENYCKIHNNSKFFSSSMKLNEIYSDRPELNIHRNGNYYKRTAELLYDLQDMSLKSVISKEYETDYEGYSKRGLLKKVTVHDSNRTIEQKEYNTTYSNLQTIDRAIFTRDVRRSGTHTRRLLETKINDPISINLGLLNSEITTSFLENGITKNTVANYYDNNKRIKSTTKSNSDGTQSETKFFYADSPEMINEPFRNELITKNIVGVPLKTETYKIGEKLSTEKTIYGISSSNNSLLLPESFSYKKGSDLNSTLEKKLTYDKYDSNGNLLQYTPEDGVPVSILWGYNRSLPIAELKNVSYNNIPGHLISNAQTASDSQNETSLLTALTALRNYFTEAMVSCYTHYPNIGIRTTIDPKGIKTTNDYDSFGRLQFVRDEENNIIKEIQHYNSNQE